MYTALCYLPDSLPSYRYLESGDTLFIKGMGDPTLLHELWPDHAGLKRMRDVRYIVLYPGRLSDQRWGDGWAWDDILEDYQPEKSALPLYSNLLKIHPQEKSFTITPSYFNSSTHVLTGIKSASRESSQNVFSISKSLPHELYIPFTTEDETITALLQDTLHIQVSMMTNAKSMDSLSWKMQYGVQNDSVFSQMMKVSDNFIAEQLLLLSYAYLTDTLNTSKMIAKAKSGLFQNLPDAFQWVDGSGLSRYNLITPANIIMVLDMIKSKIGFDRIKAIFPAGGISGTLKNSYRSDTPYVWAKTGSLSNNQSLSGYIQTHSGRVILFSFMHSNYITSNAMIRNEMQKVLEYVRDRY